MFNTVLLLLLLSILSSLLLLHYAQMSVGCLHALKNSRTAECISMVYDIGEFCENVFSCFNFHLGHHFNDYFT
jgi:hypothetical protein